MTDDGMLLKVTTIVVRKALKKSYVHDAEGSDLFRPPKAVENHQECTKDPANLPFPTHVALAVDQAIQAMQFTHGSPLSPFSLV